MSYDGQKLPKGKDASRGARSRQRRRNSVEEVENLLQQPYSLGQGGSSTPSLLPNAPGAGVPDYEPPYSFPLSQSGSEAEAPNFCQPNSYDTSYMGQEDGSLVSGSLCLDVPGQTILYQGTSSSDEALPFVPNQVVPSDNSYFYPDVTVVPTHTQPFMTTVMPGSDSSGLGLDGASGYPDHFSLERQVQQPLDTQGLDSTGYKTNWTQQCMDQTMEGPNRCTGLGSARWSQGAEPQGSGTALCQGYGFVASTAQAGGGDVPPPSRKRRGREKKTKLYELGQLDDEEEEKKRVRASKQKMYRNKKKEEEQAVEASLVQINQEIDNLRLEAGQRRESVRILETEVGRRNLGL